MKLSRIFAVLLASSIFTVTTNVTAASKKAAVQDESYSVVMIGDTHWETLPESTYHAGYKGYEKQDKSWKKKMKSIKGYAKMWEDRLPRLVKRAVSLAGPDTKFMLEVGDIIEGYTKDAPAHKKMLGDVYSYLDKASGSLPFVTVVGNHDIRGNSGTVASEAYREFMTAKMSEQLGKKIEKTTFYFTVGPDAYLVIDFNSPDNAEIEKMLNQTKNARYTFLIVHGPVIPYDNVNHYNWFLHGRGSSDADRLKFRSLFAKRKVIVLCGHTHKTEFADWKGDGGRITQLTMSSVWTKESLGEYTVDCDTPAQYGSLRLDYLEKKGKASTPEADSMFSEYRKGLKKYLHSPSAGSYRMNVSKKGVTVDFYPGDSETKAATFVLR